MPQAPDVLSAAFFKNPRPFYKIMRDEFPLYFHEPSQSYIISRYEDVNLALRDTRFTTRRYEQYLEPLAGRTLIQMEGKEHGTKRGLSNPFFSVKGVSQFRPLISRTANHLIDGFRKRGSVEFVSEYAALFPIHRIGETIGVSSEDYDKFRQWYTTILAAGTNLHDDPDINARGAQVKQELEDYLRPKIKARRAGKEGSDDLLTVLCRAEINGELLDEAEILAYGILLIFAGGETSEKGLINCLKVLVERPRELARVREERSLIIPAFVEALRHTPPTHMVPRFTGEDVEVSGGIIPANSAVLCFIGAANLDERRYVDPETFNMFREENDQRLAFTPNATHLSLGAGRHYCLGANIVKMEAEETFNGLFDAMDDIQFADGKPPAEDGLFIRAPNAMHLRFKPTARM